MDQLSTSLFHFAAVIAVASITIVLVAINLTLTRIASALELKNRLELERVARLPREEQK